MSTINQKPTVHIGNINNYESLLQCKVEGCINDEEMSFAGSYVAVRQLLSNYHVVAIPTALAKLKKIYNSI